MKNSGQIERNVALATNTSTQPPPALVITGPRGSGKTHLATTHFVSHRRITLTLPSEATQAQLDPAAFLAAHPPPVVIDDVHLAPRLIHHVAALLERQPGPPAGYVLVGSRPLFVAAAADEAFAGKARVIRLDGLSQAEIAALHPDMPLAERLFRGGFPALHADPRADVPAFMRTLVADHLARGLPGQLRVDSVHDFERFLRAAAARSGRLLNKADLAREVGIAGSTAAIWLDTLVEAGIVALLDPWKPPQAKPLVKSPKLYFLDTGLCGHLLGIRSAEELVDSPHAPALWETCVHGEIRRLAAAATPPVEPVFWRDRTKEADFLMPGPRGLVVLDAAWTEFPATADVRRLLRIRESLGPEAVATVAVVCRTPTRQALREPSGPAVETIGLDDIPSLLR